MRRLQFSYVLLSGLLFLACNRIGPEPTYPSPPAASYRHESVEIVVDGKTHRSHAAFVTPRFFKVVRVQPLIGRNFIDQEFEPTFKEVVVLSHDLWRRRFSSDPDVVGRSLKLNGRTHTVVGIMPNTFRAPNRTEIWLPDDSGRHQHQLSQYRGRPPYERWAG